MAEKNTPLTPKDVTELLNEAADKLLATKSRHPSVPKKPVVIKSTNNGESTPNNVIPINKKSK